MNADAEATASRAAAVTDAEQKVQAAEDVQKHAEAALATAQKAQGEAAAGLRNAKKDSKAKAAEHAAAEELKKNAEQVLKNFVGHNVLCFSTLRDKVSKPAEDPSPAPAFCASPAVAEPTSPTAAISASPPAESEVPIAAISTSPPAESEVPKPETTEVACTDELHDKKLEASLIHDPCSQQGLAYAVGGM